MKRTIDEADSTRVDNITEFLYKFSAAKLEQIRAVPALQMVLQHFIENLSSKVLPKEKVFRAHRKEFLQGLKYLTTNYC